MMKILILTFLISISNFVYSQSNSIDSLQKWSKALRKNNSDSSIALSKQGIILSRKLNDKKHEATFLKYIATSLEQQMLTGDAMKYYLSSQKLYEEIRDEQGISDCFQGLGNTNRASNNFEEAKLNYQKAIELRTKTKDTLGLFNTLLSLGIIHYENNILNEAKNYITEAMKIAISLNSNNLIGAAESELGNISFLEGNYKQSLNSNLFALQNFRKINDSYSEGLCLSYIAKAYNALNLPDSSLRYANFALSIIIKTKDIETQIAVFKIKSKAFELKKNLDSAYYNQGQYLTLKSKIDSTNKHIIERLNLEIVTREKQNEIEILNKNRENDKIIRNSIIAICIIILLALIIFIRSARLRKKANKELTIKNEEIQKQKEDLKHKNDEINSSIKYAERIQRTLLANDDFLNDNLPPHFVLYKPKDVVSGDFYWASKGLESITRNFIGGMLGRTENISSSITSMDDLFFMAVCDSTGHGIPGAFMSLLNISFLNQAVIENGLIKPNEILNYVRKTLIENISKDGAKDGMDAILICRNQTTGRLTYSAANNKPILIRENSIIELQIDKMPVGKGEREGDFNLFEIDFQPGDFLYLYTDGFPDQFGGPKGKKFMSKTLNKFLIEISQKPIEDQKQLLENKFEEWRGELEQVDDVCIFGLSL